MATLAKVIFLTAFVVCTVNGQYDLGAGQTGQGVQPRDRKVQVAETIPLNVNYPAKVAVPIMMETKDYSGPYDPFDPKGINAALHRQSRIDRLKNNAVIKSYIPPGVGKLAKKEAIKVAMNEGRRFAVAHPKETAELVGIATKAKTLYHTAVHKLQSTADKANH